MPSIFGCIFILIVEIISTYSYKILELNTLGNDYWHNLIRILRTLHHMNQEDGDIMQVAGNILDSGAEINL